MNNVKAMNEDMVLQTLEGGVVTIKKWEQSTVIKNLSDWLIVFNAYMDAVLIIYGNRESELNTYWNHINELCTKYKFSVVMAYDEDQKIALVMNQNSTLIEKDIEVEGKNLDLAAIKRAREEGQYSSWANMAWSDSKEICLNWNKRACAEERNCSRVHACLVCRKLGHKEKNCFQKYPELRRASATRYESADKWTGSSNNN